MSKLITAAGVTAEPGITRLRVVNGPSLGQMWRYERLAVDHIDGEHRVHASRSGGKQGRIHKEFHPHVFGATIVIDVTWGRKIQVGAVKARRRAGDWLMAGLVGLIPLAFFERFHMSEKITTALMVWGDRR